MKQKEIFKRRCSICYFARIGITDLDTNDHWCGYDFKLNSKECKKRFKLLPIFEGLYSVKDPITKKKSKYLFKHKGMPGKIISIG